MRPGVILLEQAAESTYSLQLSWPQIGLTGIDGASSCTLILQPAPADSYQANMHQDLLRGLKCLTAYSFSMSTACQLVEYSEISDKDTYYSNTQDYDQSSGALSVSKRQHCLL